MSTSPAPLVSDDQVCGFRADLYNRTQYIRKVGFQFFQNNKAYAVLDAVPVGKVRCFLALSGYRLFATGRIVHFFAIPPQYADSLVNATADATAPIFLGVTNNPPVAGGVLISVGGNLSTGEMQSAGASSVNGILNTFFLPERWKILAFIDSNEGATGATNNDGITIDALIIDFDACECIPDSLL